MADNIEGSEVASGEPENGNTSELSAIDRLAEKRKSDIFVLSGPLSYRLADRLIEILDCIEITRPNVLVFLCTSGGDPDAAFRIAKSLKRQYKHLSLYISGWCKSAGTLIALGANEIVIGSKGELGPLDVQLPKEDSFTSTSGRDSTESISSLQFEAFHMFGTVFNDLAEKYGRRFTTRTVSKIATNLVVGLLTPIAAQIDPLKLAENHRALNIARKYGEQLGADSHCINRLIYGYPSHGHVIDLDEAKKIFGERVRSFDCLDSKVEKEIQSVMEDYKGKEGIRWPLEEGDVLPFSLLEQEEGDGDDDDEPEEANGEECDSGSSEE